MTPTFYIWEFFSEKNKASKENISGKLIRRAKICSTYQESFLTFRAFLKSDV